MTKECTRCNIILKNDNFTKQKRGKLGTHSICKMCMNTIRKEYGRTKNGLLKCIYLSQKSRMKKMFNQDMLYTFDEFLEWSNSKKEFHILFSKWELSVY